MFYTLNKYKNFQMALAALLFAWSVYTIFVQMTPYPPEGQPLLYQPVFSLWMTNPVLCKVMVSLIVLSEVLILEYFFLANKFSENRTALPPVFFLLFLNVGHFLTQLTPAFFTMFAILLLLLVNANPDNGRPDKNRIFLSGVLVALAALVDVAALCLIPFMIFALLTDNIYHPKDVLVLLSGTLLVVTYLISYYYLSDSFPVLWESYRQLTFFAFFTHFSSLWVMDWVLIAYLLLSLLYMIAVLKIHYDTKLIVLRKRFMVLVFLFFIMIIAILLAGMELSCTLIYLVVPLALFDSMLSQLKNKRLLNDVLMAALLVLLWF